MLKKKMKININEERNEKMIEDEKMIRKKEKELHYILIVSNIDFFMRKDYCSKTTTTTNCKELKSWMMI